MTCCAVSVVKFETRESLKDMKYASFKQRLAAKLIDFVLLLPFWVLAQWLGGYSIPLAMILISLATLLTPVYDTFFLGRFSQTIGKRIMRIRAVRLHGTRIGWKEAFLRNLVDYGISIPQIIASIISLSAISEASYYGATWSERSKALSAHNPSWLTPLAVLSIVWWASELVVMLTNARRRGLQDFIAGTVIVSD